MKGHIKQRSKGSWALWVDLGRDPETGKRKQQTMTVRGSKKDAERELRAVLTRIEGGAHVKPAKLTVGEHLERWLQDYVTTNTAPTTAAGYKDIIRAHLIPSLGSILLTALQPSHIQAYYARMLESGRRDGKGGLSAQTMKHHHRVLYEALKHAVKHGVLVRNVAEAADSPRPGRSQITTLTEEQVRLFLQVAAVTPYRDLFTVAIYTGMRRSELLGIRWKDTDLDLAQLSVTQTLHRLANRGFIFGEPKTARSRRTIALPPSVCIVLRQLRERQAREKLLLGLSVQDDDLVFSQPDGKPLDPWTVSHAFRQVTERAGIPHVRLHDLRHTHASLMLKQGIHPKIVSERLGHSSVSITLDTYSHVMPGLQEAAALRFEQGLQQALEEPTAEALANG